MTEDTITAVLYLFYSFLAIRNIHVTGLQTMYLLYDLDSCCSTITMIHISFIAPRARDPMRTLS